MPRVVYWSLRGILLLLLEALNGTRTHSHRTNTTETEARLPSLIRDDMGGVFKVRKSARKQGGPQQRWRAGGVPTIVSGWQQVSIGQQSVVAPDGASCLPFSSRALVPTLTIKIPFPSLTLVRVNIDHYNVLLSLWVSC